MQEKLENGNSLFRTVLLSTPFNKLPRLVTKRQFTHKLELFACWVSHGTITVPCYILLDPLLTEKEKENIVVQGCWISLTQLSLFIIISMPIVKKVLRAESTVTCFLFDFESFMLGVIRNI